MMLGRGTPGLQIAGLPVENDARRMAAIEQATMPDTGRQLDFLYF